MLSRLLLALLACALAGQALPGDGPAAVRIHGFAFDPTQLLVAAGDTVTWTNEDTAPHSVVPLLALPSRGWNSDDLQNGQSFAHAFATPGAVIYYCGVHPGMRGEILVVPALPG